MRKNNNDKNRVNINELIVDKLIKKIEEENIMPWQREHIKEGLPYNYNTGRKYSGRNLLLLLMANYNRQGFMTYKQAAERGYAVRKGEHGLPIVWAQSGEYVPVELENEKGEVESYMTWKRGGARAYYVFNVSQIDGISERPHETEGNKPDVNLWLSQLPIKWVYGKNPTYNFAEDVIGIPYENDFNDVGCYYSTLFHEMIHWTGAENRLCRTMTANKENEAYSYEELIAEIGSAFLRGTFHIQSPKLDESNAAYVKGWLNAIKADKTTILSAATEAQRAVDYLMEIGKNVQQIQTLSPLAHNNVSVL